MGIWGYLLEGRNCRISPYELIDWTILNSLVEVVHIKNIFVHVVRFLNHPTNQPRNGFASFLLQKNTYGDVVVYAIDDEGEPVLRSRMESFLRAMRDKMNDL
jgi:hypothetical protein